MLPNKLKWILVIVAILIVVLVFSIYIFLASYDYNNLKPQITKAVLDATGRELTIGGDIDLHVGLRPALVLSDIKFQNAPWGSRPELVKTGRFEVKVSIFPLLTGNIVIKQLVLVEPDILVETNKSGKSNLEFETQIKTDQQQETKERPLEVLTTLPVLSFNNLKVEGGHITYRDGRTGKNYEILLNQFTAKSSGFDRPLEIALKGNFNNESFHVSGYLGQMAALVKSGKDWPFDIKIEALNVTVTLKGSFKDVLNQRGLNLDFTIHASDMTKLAQFTGKPVSLNEPFEISGHTSDIGSKTYKISELKIIMDDNNINGLIEINLSKKLPRLSAELSSQRLDLRPLMSQYKDIRKSEAKPTSRTQNVKRVFPSNPLPLDELRKVEGTIKVQVKQLLLPELAANDMTVETTLKNGQITFDPIKATIGDGTLHGLITLTPQAQTAALIAELKAEGIEIESMLKELNITNVLEGKIDVDMNLKGRGESVATLMANLDGHTNLLMSDGRIKNKYIDLLGADLSTSIFRLINPIKKKTDFTEINCMVSRFDIKNGLAESTVLVIDTSNMSVVGEGQIDLEEEKLDLSLKPLPKEGVGSGRFGKLSLSLGELAKPFRLGGTLAEPSLALDPKQTAIILGKTIGGTLLFGPIGIAAALISGSSGDDNPCLAAIEAAKNGVKVSGDKKTEKENGMAEKSIESVTEEIKDTGRNIGKTLKNLFGK